MKNLNFRILKSSVLICTAFSLVNCVAPGGGGNAGSGSGTGSTAGTSTSTTTTTVSPPADLKLATYWGAVTGKSVTAERNGWYRVSMTLHNTTATGGAVWIHPSTRTSASNYADWCTILIWGAQVEQGSAATAYSTSEIPTAIVPMASNKNLLAYSEDFSRWRTDGNGDSLYILSTNVNSPEGSADATKIIAWINEGYSAQFSASAANVDYTFSIYVKGGTADDQFCFGPSYIQMNLGDGQSGGVKFTLPLSN